MTGDSGTSCAVPPYAHISDSRKQWHNVQLTFRVCMQQTRLQLHFGLGGGCIHLPPARLKCRGEFVLQGKS